jgi:hypothetical protein
MKPGPLLRVGATLLVVFGVVWVGVVLHWRRTGIEPTAGHIVAYLVLLPLALFGLVLLLRLAWRRFGRKRSAGPPLAGAGVVPAAAGEAAIDDGPQPDRVLQLLAGAVWLRAGDQPLAAAQALAKPERPPLHASLKDALGLPVFVAAVDQLDPAVAASVLESALAESGSSDPLERLVGEEAVRALALLDPVAEELLYAALPAPTDNGFADEPQHGGLHPHAMHHSRSVRAAAPGPRAAMLQVRVLLPAQWPAAAHSACVDWLRRKALAVGFAAETFAVEALPVASPAEAWRLLDPATGLVQDDGDRHLLLAAQSLVGEAAVARLDTARELLADGHPEGRIPGEGAAGVLLSPTAASRNDAPEPIRLHRVLHGRAGHGRAASRAAAALLQSALDTAGCPAEEIALVFSDADHRPSRAIEAAGAIAAALPELEPVEHARHLGLVCGDLGTVAPLALLATAAAQAGADGKPVLALSVADQAARSAFVLSPQPAADTDHSGSNAGTRTPAAAAATA